MEVILARRFWVSLCVGLVFWMNPLILIFIFFVCGHKILFFVCLRTDGIGHTVYEP